MENAVCAGMHLLSACPGSAGLGFVSACENWALAMFFPPYMKITP